MSPSLPVGPSGRAVDRNHFSTKMRTATGPGGGCSAAASAIRALRGLQPGRAMPAELLDAQGKNTREERMAGAAPDIDAVVVGAGFSGIAMLKSLRDKLGLKV